MATQRDDDRYVATHRLKDRTVTSDNRGDGVRPGGRRKPYVESRSVMSSRHRRRFALLALATAASLLGPAPVDAAAGDGSAVASDRGRDAGPGSRLALGTVPPPGTRVRGTVERIAVERHGPGDREDVPPPPDGAGHADPSVVTVVRTASGAIRVRNQDLAGVPAGSTVDVRLGDPGTRTPLAARSGAGRAASAPHEVTLALVVPPGGSRDATTPADLSRLLTGPVSDFWSRQSGGRVSFRVMNTPSWTTTTASCADPLALWADVGRRTGFVEGPGRHLVVYVTSRGTDDCWYALATVGVGASSGGRLFTRGLSASVMAHELGHNLGLGHSNALHCRGVPDGTWAAGGWNPACERTEYGDWYDVMGISWDRLGTLSTAHAYRLGFLGRDAVRTVGSPTTAELVPVSAGSGLRSLRIEDPGGGSYVVEYRSASGADAWLASNWPGLRPGVVVRRADPVGGDTETLLLDASPSASGRRADRDVPLAPGATLTTASGRVAVRVDDVTAAGARVSVAFDGRWPGTPFGRSGRIGDGVDPRPSATASPGSGRVGRRGG